MQPQRIRCKSCRIRDLRKLPGLNSAYARNSKFDIVLHQLLLIPLQKKKSLGTSFRHSQGHLMSRCKTSTQGWWGAVAANFSTVGLKSLGSYKKVLSSVVRRVLNTAIQYLNCNCLRSMRCFPYYRELNCKCNLCWHNQCRRFQSTFRSAVGANFSIGCFISLGREVFSYAVRKFGARSRCIASRGFAA